MKAIFTILLLQSILFSCKTYNLLEESKTDVKFLNLNSNLGYNPNYQNYR